MTGSALAGTRAPSWVLCDRCRLPIYGKRLLRAQGVCPECGHHRRLTAVERLAQLLDPGSERPIEAPAVAEDMLGFVDQVPYRDRLSDARRRTGLHEAAIAALGRVCGIPVAAVVMEFEFMGGSLSNGVGELITVTAELALEESCPLVIVCASGGARMQEGALSLMQMVKTSQALLALDNAGIPTVSIITDPTFGGVTASFATLCDVIIAEPGARMGFAGARVIERTIRQQLPDGFQTAEFLLEHGQVDAIRTRAQLRGTLHRLLSVLAARPRRTDVGNKPVSTAARRPPALLTEARQLPAVDSWDIARMARNPSRPCTLDYIRMLIDDFEELHGDRLGGECPATVGGVGMLDGRPVMVIGQQKGHTAAELNQRNFGMPLPAGYRKAARLMRLAAKCGIPVLTFVDTGGAYPGVSAEENGQALAIAENLKLMCGLPVPIVSVIISEGGSGGALGIAVADRVLILANAFYSVISPEGCAAILWRDAAAAPQAARALRLSARDLLEMGVVDGVVAEPDGGAQADHEEMAQRLGDALRAALDELRSVPGPELVAARRARYRAFGRSPANSCSTTDARMPA